MTNRDRSILIKQLEDLKLEAELEHYILNHFGYCSQSIEELNKIEQKMTTIKMQLQVDKKLHDLLR